MVSIDNHTIKTTSLDFLKYENVYRGKVRDVYQIDDMILLVATDRISAFDHILPRPIPYKGQVLNQIAIHFLNATKDLVPNWYRFSPDPNISLGLKAQPIKIEMVVRGYLAGHAWRTYNNGKRSLCGVYLPEGLRENDRLPSPIITPTTKADEGHDQDISVEDILKNKIVSSDQWEQLSDYALKLYKRGQEMAQDRGLILVDTKYEFGIVDNEIILIDEIHTPDSSRYFYQQGYEDRQNRGEKQIQLSKEFVREWLIENGFQGLHGQVMPPMSDEIVWNISDRYIELYELVIGQKFVKADTTHIQDRIATNVQNYFNSIKKT